MRILRAHISGWTASFRNPLFVVGFQPTLPIPPLSTLYGLLSAACGEIVTPDDTPIGFVFQSSGIGRDLETVYEIDTDFKAKSNIYTREFLVDPELYLYISNLQFKPYLERPKYPLLLGRSTELASVMAIDETELEEVSEVEYKDTLLPFSMEGIYGPIQSLPTFFTQERPRRPQRIRPFYLVTNAIKYSGSALRDPEKDWGVYIHNQADNQ